MATRQLKNSDAYPSLTTLPERVSVLEEKVRNMDEKLDGVKDDIKELHDDIKESNTTLVTQLKEMQVASTTQHGELAGKIKDLEQFKNKWIYMILGAVAVLGFLSGHADTLLKLLAK